MKSKKMKRAFCAIIAIGAMVSGLTSVHAQIELEETFNGTIEDVFGTDRRTGPLNDGNGGSYILDWGDLKYDGSAWVGKTKNNGGYSAASQEYAMTYYTVADGCGTLQKRGGRVNYTMGWKADFSQAALEYNTERIAEAGTEDTPTKYITQGKWEYYVDFQDPKGEPLMFIFQKDNTDVLALFITAAQTNTVLGTSSTPNAGVTSLASGTTITGSGNSFVAYVKTRPHNKVKLVLDMDEKTLGLQMWNGSAWKSAFQENADISGYTDLLSGFNGIAYRQRFNASVLTTNFYDVSVKSADGAVTLFNADFEDSDKNWEDYGFTAFNDRSSLVYGKNTIKFLPYVGGRSYMDKQIGRTVNSGIYVVEFTTQCDASRPESGSNSMTFNGAGSGWNKNREMIQFVNRSAGTDGTETVSLGIGNTYPFGHTLGVGTVNGTTPSSLTVFNSAFKKDGNKSYVLQSTGTDYKLVLDLDAHKLYTYITAQNVLGYQLVNPDGYTLPNDFSFNDIRFQVCYQAANRTSWGSFSNIKMYSLASAVSEDEVKVSQNGEVCDITDPLYIGNGDTVSSKLVIYTEPGTTKNFSMFTAVYDSNGGLVNVYTDEQTINSGTSIFSGSNTISESLDDKSVKLLLWDTDTLLPLMSSVDFEGVAEE